MTFIGPPEYLFLDVETPGVDDLALDRIFEVAAIVTDIDGNELGRYETVVRPTPESLDRLHANEFVVAMHKKSGLYDILTGPDADNLPELAEAEDGVLALLADHLTDGQKIAIAGSGVSRFDHPMLDIQMPRLAARLFYWEQDPSSARRHYKRVTGTDVVPQKPEKTHRAMADIEDDIRHVKAFGDIYRAAALPTYNMDPQTRALTAIGLTEAFMSHDSFHTADGVEVATTGTANAVYALLDGMSALDVAAGYMDIAERLVIEMAAREGKSAEQVIADLRGSVLASRKGV